MAKLTCPKKMQKKAIFVRLAAPLFCFDEDEI